MAREQGGATRVDLLYVHFRNAGAELHVVHWDDFAQGTHTTGRLTTSTMAAVGGSTELVQLGWLGYDATLDGDDVLVCVHEQTIDTGALGSTPVVSQAIGTGDPPEIFGAAPPPLAPGLTQPVAAFNASHAQRLRLVRLD